jgi:LDH2 family malate/lactate/ureidoglycolate dehydrogenase
MGDVPTTGGEALHRLRALGLDEASVTVLFDHLEDAERRGKASHGYVRVPWLEAQEIDTGARAVKAASVGAVDFWEGRGSLGYLTLAAICSDLLEREPCPARLVVASGCFPTGALGYWVRLLAGGGLVALLTTTSPRRLSHPDGGSALTGTNPLAIGIPSSTGDPIVVDVSMGAVTHGDVLTGRARPEELVPFGGALAHKAFALAVGLELLVGALAGPEHGAVLLVARPEHDPVPAFRRLAAGLRLPGDS